MIRQPVGVVAVITPFNFPGMIPPGSFLTQSLRQHGGAQPSEKTPLTMARILQLTEQRASHPA
jgi:malonate-semialdehyde dehydrogenase (acetylating)/methylmalonate-semialdehyde dehydrogenase